VGQLKYIIGYAILDTVMSLECVGNMTEKPETWTSAGDFGRTLDFYWDSTGEFLGPHLNWAANEPRIVNDTDYYCMSSNYDGVSYKWRNHYYSSEKLYICESRE
jgi:hypothetical protein